MNFGRTVLFARHDSGLEFVQFYLCELSQVRDPGLLVPIDEVTEDDRQALTEDDESAEPALLDGPRRGPCCRARWFTRQQDRVSDHRVRSKEIRPRQLVPLLRWCSRSPRACSIIWWVASVRPRQISGQAESH